MVWDKIELCAQRWESGPVYSLLCVWEQYNGVTDIQQQLSYKSTQYLITACMFQTLSLPSHDLQSWVVNLLQFLYSNFNTIVLAPDSSVCGCGLWRSDLFPNVLFSGRGGVGGWKRILHNEVNNLRNTHYLSLYPSLEGDFTVLISCYTHTSKTTYQGALNNLLLSVGKIGVAFLCVA